MIRLFLGYFAVILALCAIVVFSPFRWITGGGEPVEAMDVPPQPVAAAVAPDASASAVLALSEAAALGAAGTAPAVEGLRVESGGDLDATTEAILAALAGTPPDANAAALEGMSRNALAGLRARTEKPAAQDVSLQSLVAQALHEGQSDAYIDALVNEAAGQGAITVPAMLVTSEGRVDTAVLLATLVARSQEAELGEGDAASQADVVLTPEAAAVAAGSDVTYTVRVGDSLGSLALRFYGDSALYPAIFEANRGKLASPDRLRSGQVLIIPGRS